MWLMTKHGFYSIVQKGDEFHVRSREREDLQNLIKRVPLLDCKVIDTRDGDYVARIITDQATVALIVLFLADTLDYSNFKGKISETPDQRHKPYHEVWDVMATALGAYGAPGRAKRRQ